MKKITLEKMRSLDGDSALKRSAQRKKKLPKENESVFEAYLKEAEEELEEYHLELPLSNRFWDNGFEDVERIA